MGSSMSSSRWRCSLMGSSSEMCPRYVETHRFFAQILDAAH
jgi:hypothetical protein